MIFCLSIALRCIIPACVVCDCGKLQNVLNNFSCSKICHSAAEQFPAEVEVAKPTQNLSFCGAIAFSAMTLQRPIIHAHDWDPSLSNTAYLQS